MALERTKKELNFDTAAITPFVDGHIKPACPFPHESLAEDSDAYTKKGVCNYFAKCTAINLLLNF